MEKRSAHYRLSIVRRFIELGEVRATTSAVTDAKAMGFDYDGMIAVVSALTHRDFYKSMTTYSDHRIWQDVYRPTTPAGDLYVKLTVINDVLIVSFKEL